MIKKLRKKLILINVIAVCIVFFIGIVFMFGTGYRRIDEERLERLNGLLTYDNWKQAVDHQYKGTVLVEYDLTTNEIVNKSIGIDFKPVEELDSAVKEIVAEKSDSGWLNTRTLYVKRTAGNVVRIVVFDGYSSGANTVRVYLLLSVIALVVGAMCYFVISFVLARVALKPVEESWNKQKQFVADASHELKTPLSVIMANTEIIASHGEESVQSQMKWIENTRSESQRMAELVNQLLFLAKNDDGLIAQMEICNLSECVETVVLSHEAVFYENGKSFNYNIAPELYVWGNDGQLKQLATILLDNANKYSTDDGNITFSVAAVGKNSVLTLSNDCEELTDDQLMHLFDRFYTVDKSRNKNNAGNGLGLSIAQVICRSHRGDVSVHYDEGRITFTATLPLSKSKQ